jgi:hypothetical protein
MQQFPGDRVYLQPTADPDKPCYHPDFAAVVDVQRIGQGDADNPTPGMPRTFVAEVQIKCAACGERFKFTGVPAGLSFVAPATSVDGFELRAPIVPDQAPAGAGRRAGEVTGFAVTMTRASEAHRRRGPGRGRG